MNKEQIQLKFENLLEEKFKFLPNEQGQIFLGQAWINVKEMTQLLEQVFNLGLEVAADNAEADYTLLGEWKCEPSDIECYVLKNSILQFKL